MRALLTACAIGASALALTACASDGYGSGYGGGSRYANGCRSNGDEVAGAVVGGGVGALAGSAIAGRGDRTEGAVIGGVAGAVIGSQVAKSDNCGRNYNDRRERRTYYDRDGRPYYR